MTFRDEMSAAAARRDALRASPAPEDREELATLEARIDAERTRALTVLQNVKIATPCPASWAGMVGDDRARHCALCDKHVYDLSALTAVEAVRLIATHEGSLCARLYRRRDGTLITGDCAVGRKRRRKRAFVAGAAALAVGAAATFAVRPEPAPLTTATIEPSAARTWFPQPPFELDEDAFLHGPPDPLPPPLMGAIISVEEWEAWQDELYNAEMIGSDDAFEVISEEAPPESSR